MPVFNFYTVLIALGLRICEFIAAAMDEYNYTFVHKLKKKNTLGVILMPRKNRPVNPKAADELDSLKEEVAEELHLADDIEKRGWENMTTREAGKIGGNMVKKMINLAEEEMDKKEGNIEECKSKK